MGTEDRMQFNHLPLAEALQVCSDLRWMREEIIWRLKNNAVLSENTPPEEDIERLFRIYQTATTNLRELEPKIKRTKLAVVVDNGPLAIAEAERHRLTAVAYAYSQATEVLSRKMNPRSPREIRIIPVLPATELRETIEKLKIQARLIEAGIQRASWQTKLMSTVPTEYNQYAVDLTLEEALAIRAQIWEQQNRLVERLRRNLLVQEGDVPQENPMQLLHRYEKASFLSRDLTVAINLTNGLTRLGEGTIGDALADRDDLKLQIRGLQGVVTATASVTSGYDHEIRKLVTINVRKLQDDIDDLFDKKERLSRALKRKNWETKLVSTLSAVRSLQALAVDSNIKLGE